MNEGSYGARATKDGLDTVDNLMANTKNVPCEEIELRYPLRVEKYEIRPEQPGAGTWRGGCGHVREVRFLKDGYFSCNGDRILEKPFGIFEGLDGHGARLTLNPGTINEVEWPSKVSGQKVKSGDVIRVCGPASAGYGNPLLRDPNLVLNDVLDGIIDAKTATEVYGVVLKQKNLDLDATKAKRNK